MRSWMAFIAMSFTLALMGGVKAAAAEAAAPVSTAITADMLDGFNLDGTNWTYEKDGRTFNGILIKPEGDGPFPLILISHGMGGTPQGFAMPKAQDWVARGYVCIAPLYTHGGGAGSRGTEAGAPGGQTGARRGGQRGAAAQGANAPAAGAEQGAQTEGSTAGRRGGRGQRGAAPTEGAATEGAAPAQVAAAAEGAAPRGQRGQQTAAEDGATSPGARRGGRGGGGMGNSGSSPENLIRAKLCIAFAKTMPYVDGKRIYAYGNSMGAFLTVGLAGDSPDLLAAAAITAGGIRAGAATSGGSSSPGDDLANKIKCPFLILHGTADTTVNPAMSEALKAVLDANGVENERKLWEGETHNLHANKKEEVNKLIADWFDSHTGK